MNKQKDFSDRKRQQGVIDELIIDVGFISPAALAREEQHQKVIDRLITDVGSISPAALAMQDTIDRLTTDVGFISPAALAREEQHQKAIDRLITDVGSISPAALAMQDTIDRLTTDVGFISPAALAAQPQHQELRKAVMANLGSMNPVVFAAQARHQAIEPNITQYPSPEAFREAESLEEITVPKHDEGALDKCKVPEIFGEKSLEKLLWEINPNLVNLLQGARQALNTDNPDRARHVTVSLRELVREVLDRVAPDDKIQDWTDDPCHYHKGRPKRQARLWYINREISSGPLSKCVSADETAFLVWFQKLNAGTHAIRSRLTDRELQSLVFRIESDLLLWLRENSTNK